MLDQLLSQQAAHLHEEEDHLARNVPTDAVDIHVTAACHPAESMDLSATRGIVFLYILSP